MPMSSRDAEHGRSSSGGAHLGEAGVAHSAVLTHILIPLSHAATTHTLLDSLVSETVGHQTNPFRETTPAL